MPWILYVVHVVYFLLSIVYVYYPKHVWRNNSRPVKYPNESEVFIYFFKLWLLFFNYVWLFSFFWGGDGRSFQLWALRMFPPPGCENTRNLENRSHFANFLTPPLPSYSFCAFIFRIPVGEGGGWIQRTIWPPPPSLNTPLLDYQSALTLGSPLFCQHWYWPSTRYRSTSWSSRTGTGRKDDPLYFLSIGRLKVICDGVGNHIWFIYINTVDTMYISIREKWIYIIHDYMWVMVI